jgi:hypothetical protein
MHRFSILAILVPVFLLSCSQSKQGKYILMIYPFTALLMGEILFGFTNEAEPSSRARRFGSLFAGLFGFAGLAAFAITFLGLGPGKLQTQIAPYLKPAIIASLILMSGASLFAWDAIRGRARHFARDMGITIGLLILTFGTWGFRQLDSHKGYRKWTEEVKPIITGRQVYFWQPNHLKDVSAGAMIYTNNLTMPTIRNIAQLEEFSPGTLLAASERDWPIDQGGLTDAGRAMFITIVKMPVGGGGLILMQKAVDGGSYSDH